jgi:diaminopimelate epimerase
VKGAGRQGAWRMEAAGNRFVVVEEGGLEGELGRAQRAVELCADEAWRADGLLVLGPAAGGRALRMEIYNADGSRALACGNGLRCAGAWAVARGVCSPAAEGGVRRVEVETAAGKRWAEVGVEVAAPAAGPAGPAGPAGSASSAGEPEPAARPAAWRVRAGLGAVTWERRALPVVLDGAEYSVERLDLANPHAVVMVDSVVDLPLARWAREVELSAGVSAGEPGGLRGGLNVEFVERVPCGPGDLRLRVHERGVGETGSCGTGACAAATVAARHLDLRPPLNMVFPGGTLRVGWEDGEAWVEGPVRMHSRAGAESLTEGESSVAEQGKEAVWAT